MELVTRVQILGEAISISLCTDALGKGMNPSVLSLAKILEQNRFFSLG